MDYTSISTKSSRDSIYRSQDVSNDIISRYLCSDGPPNQWKYLMVRYITLHLASISTQINGSDRCADFSPHESFDAWRGSGRYI